MISRVPGGFVAHIEECGELLASANEKKSGFKNIIDRHGELIALSMDFYGHSNSIASRIDGCVGLAGTQHRQ